MGLFEDLTKGTPPPSAETPQERKAAGPAKVSIEMKEEKLFMNAGMSKKFPVILKNEGAEDDTLRVKIDMLYNYEARIKCGIAVSG